MLAQRKLGKTGIHVSCLGLGTVKFGRTHNLRYPSEFALPDDNQLKHLLSIARESGINLIDTAPAYGYSEERLGDLLKSSRKDWIISTKAGEEFSLNKATNEAQSYFDYSGKQIRLSVERSLRRLKTDYLDLLLIHSDGQDQQILMQTEAVETLIQLKQEGWIRAHGISSKTLEGGMIAADMLDVLMVTYSQNNPDEQQVIDKCAETGAGVLLKKVFGSGHIDHNGQKEALRFAFASTAVSSAVIGTINPEHLQDNVKCALIANSAG